ncbi:helix-turn-helix transcriptional regulator [Aureibacter tunicatorum]|uniref:Transcriptional regulator with XRE-family HTH domain n=1 Tax=Aureibacter tunicatorum TaxID=866807 RepID=A0AAE3XNZ7_9BACT|nr:helix-turn-helix transcriptional regulator [Aureibacter tunicatorum]MDR6239962.1 transcriptional regulator with XRE-family HTH domain [Aureibacter tunicatorum]BDD04435.1 hypothetical protein AUTU_19180 [Aureibacter tunicatorum]
MTDSINERLEFLLQELRYNRSEFARKVGVSIQTIHNILGEKKTKPTFEVINKILKNIPDINSDWLILGAGEMYRGVDDSTKVEEEPAKEKRFSPEIQKYIDSIVNKYETQINKKDKQIDNLITILSSQAAGKLIGKQLTAQRW